MGGGVEMSEEGDLGLLEGVSFALVDVGDYDLIGDHRETNQGQEFDQVL